MTEKMNSFLASLRTAYLQQGQAGRILLPGLALLVVCCLCLIPLSLLPLRARSNVLPSPVVLPGEGTAATPTSLFAFPTFTPFLTLTSFVPTAFPTFTPSPTGTITPTRTIPPATETPLPTATVTLTPTPVSPVAIINVDKVAEYVEIQNFTQAEVNLRGWRLVSENGDEACGLRGTLEPGGVLRIWARRGDPGFDCRLGREIWIDDELDPAVLYNPDQEEVSRYP